MKARQCDECRNGNLNGGYSHAKRVEDNICQLGHQPRFYKPRSPMDQSWGWKRKCDDYQAMREGE